MTFLKVGSWLFARAHICAINLNDETQNFHPAVSLRIAGDNDPWLFHHGTPEAEAIKAFVESIESPAQAK